MSETETLRKCEEEWRIITDAIRESVRATGYGANDIEAMAQWVNSQEREASEAVARCAAHWEYHERASQASKEIS